MMSITYPLRTARLELRPHTIHDLDAVHGIQSLDSVARFQFWEPRDREQVREWIQEKIGLTITDEDGSQTLAVVLPESGTIIGDVVLFMRAPGRQLGEVGASFHPDYHSKGYAAESLLAMMELGFETFGLHRIIARYDPRNTAACRVTERIGMRHEAHFIKKDLVKGVWTDEGVSAMLDTEWQAHRSEAGSCFRVG
jgi:RimJ/RimL family protein N-acetyltransferase